jgi:hypothetical protein
MDEYTTAWLENEDQEDDLEDQNHSWTWQKDTYNQEENR